MSAVGEIPSCVDVFDVASVGMAITDRAGRCVHVNAAFARLVARDPSDLIGEALTSLLDPVDADAVAATMVDLLAGSVMGARSDRRCLRRDDPDVWVDLGIRCLSGSDGAPAGFLAEAVDISERKGAEEAAERDRRLLEAAERLAHLGSFEQDTAVDAIYASAMLREMLGVPEGRTLDVATLIGAVHPDDRDVVAAAIARCVIDHVPADITHRFVSAGGTVRWVHAQAAWAPPRDNAIGEGTVIGAVLDITEAHEAMEAVEHQMFHDSLTGLPNRLLITHELEEILSRANRGGTSTAVMIVDVDRLKTINDGLGHHVGDAVLQAVGKRLKSLVRTGDTPARFAGDEFAVVCDRVDPIEARQIAERLADPFGGTVAIDGRELRITACVGVRLAGPGDTPGRVLREAETAMYRAKRGGPGRVALFEQSLDEQAARLVHGEEALRAALARHEFELRYQPVIDIETMELAGVEALIRWNDPVRGQVPPADFVPLAEEVGLIHAIGAWVLRQACHDLPRIRTTCRSERPLAINVSARQLADSGLFDSIAAILRETGTDPRALTVEVTESALLGDADTASATLTALHDLGVLISLDDFGTGYSSLTFLKRFPIDVIKVDRSFVSGLGKDPNDALLVAAIVNLAHILGLEVVAEGVETARQLEELRNLECRYAQGFLFSPAVPVDELEQFSIRAPLTRAFPATV